MTDDPLCPEKWDAERIAEKRRDPCEFARQFMLEPFDPNVFRFSGRRSGQTADVIERVVALAKVGVDVSGIRFVCASKKQAEHVMRELVRRIGPVEVLPQVEEV